MQCYRLSLNPSKSASEVTTTVRCASLPPVELELFTSVFFCYGTYIRW